MEPIRKAFTQEIDVKATLQAYAESLIKQADQEKAIRNNRRYKQAIRKTFAIFPKSERITIRVLAVFVLQSISVKPEQYSRLMQEVIQHIKLNRGRYLRVIPGPDGGVELTRP